MKIITPGNVAPTEYLHTCGGCGCHFSFTLAEVKRVSDPREGEYYKVKCPQPGCAFTSDIAAEALHRSPTSPS